MQIVIKIADQEIEKKSRLTATLRDIFPHVILVKPFNFGSVGLPLVSISKSKEKLLKITEFDVIYVLPLTTAIVW